MDSPVFFDHLYVLLYAIVYPVYGYFTYQKILKLIEAGVPPERSRLYVSTLVGHWAIMFVGAILWYSVDRGWASMGFSFDPDRYFLLGVLFAMAVVVVLAMQVRKVGSASDENIRSLQSQCQAVAPILPQSHTELQWFYRVSITAGIVEELLWRGALIWYLSHYLPLWGAAVVSSIVFGLAHSYQGKDQIPKVTAIGAVFATLYLLTGSIWVPMILHALFDMLQGRLAHDVLTHPSLNAPLPSGEIERTSEISGA